jgi:hypothetical protein
MPIVRSYTNAFEVVDYTQELAIVPNSWTLLTDSGLFSEEYLTTRTVTFEQTDYTLGLIADQYWGAKPQANKDDIRKIHSFAIPHFPVVDALLPSDINGVRAYGNQNAAMTEAEALARKIARIRKNYDVTKEVAAFKTLTTGTAYAPNGTVVTNFYTDMGVTQTVVDFVLGTASTDVVAKVESVIASMQDNALTGDVITGIIGYASPEFFAKLIAHAKVQAAYTYYSATSGQEIQRNRAGGGTGLYREFTYAGIRFIEVRTVLAGQRLVPANDCIFVPIGTSDSFVRYYAPANKFGYVNTIAEPAYMWTTRDAKGERIDIDAESNFINVLRRPQLVIRGTTSN